MEDNRELIRSVQAEALKSVGKNISYTEAKGLIREYRQREGDKVMKALRDSEPSYGAVRADIGGSTPHTIVGHISGAGNRHIVTVPTARQKPVNFPQQDSIPFATKSPFQLTGSGVSGDTVEAGDIDGTAFAKHTGALSGDVYGCVTINSSTGAVTGRTVIYTGTKPSDTTTLFYVLIGNYRGGTLAQYRYGPVTTTVCRNWFSNPATYGVTFA